MKKVPIHLLPLLFLLTTLLSTIRANSPTPSYPSEEKIKLLENKQVLEFFINTKTNALNAKLTVEQVFQCQSSIPNTIRQVVSFDTNAEVSGFWIKRTKKTRTIEPIIMDYESDGIFHNDLKLAVVERKIEGVGTELKMGYKKVFTDIRFLNSLYFQQQYPTDLSTIIIKVPNWLTLQIEQLNFDISKVGQVEQIVGDSKIYTFNQVDLKKPSALKGTPSRQKIAAHLIVIPNAYQVGGKERQLFNSVADLYKWYSSLVKQVGNTPTVLKDLVQDLTKDKTTDEEKIQAIYYWVQDNIRYIAFEDGINGFRPEDCQSVYTNKYGDCKGMANLTKEMLLLAGYDARLTWMGTRDIPYSYDIPSLMVDNHMICTVLLNGEKLFLDATQKFTGIKEYGYYIQEQEALIEDGDNFIRTTIPLTADGHHQEASTQYLRLENNQLLGKGSTVYSGSSRIQLAHYLSSIGTEKRAKLLNAYLSNSNKNVDIAIMEVPDWTTRDAAMTVDYELRIDNQVIDLGVELYVNMDITNPFGHAEIPKKRTIPYEYSDKYLLTATTEITLPEGASVTYLPEAVAIQTDKYAFQLSYEQVGNKVLYKKHLSLKETTIAVADFKEWNAAIKQLKSFYEDQIILKK